VSAYVDGSNIFHSGDKIRMRVDYAKLIPFIVSSRTLIDLNFYDTTENKPAEVKFFAHIQSLGYTLKIVKLHRYDHQTPEEKRIDTQIVADSLVDGLVNNKFDVALFATGDKDILPAMEYLLAAKKEVEVMSFDHSLAWDIKNSGARIISLTNLANQIRRI
jgi:uncharacterized LabA/DUF88 family protein